MLSRGETPKSVRPVALAGSHPPAARSDTERGCEKPLNQSNTMNRDRRLPPHAGEHARRVGLLEIHKRRMALENAIDRLIDLLDVMDGDPNHETDGSAELSWQPELRGGCLVRAA